MSDYIKTRFIRGDSGNLFLKPLRMLGNHTERKIQFTLLEDQGLTADIIFKKRSTNHEGQSDELIISYDSEKNETLVMPRVLPEDTASIKLQQYYFSLTSTAVDNINDTLTTHRGEIRLEWDGESDFNGIELSEDARKFIHIKASQAEVDDIIIVAVDPATNEKYFEFITLAQLKNKLEQIP